VILERVLKGEEKTHLEKGTPYEVESKEKQKLIPSKEKKIQKNKNGNKDQGGIILQRRGEDTATNW